MWRISKKSNPYENVRTNFGHETDCKNFICWPTLFCSAVGLIELVYHMTNHIIDHVTIRFLMKFSKLIKKLVRENSFMLIQISISETTSSD